MEMILDIHLTYSYMYIHNVIINIIIYMTECWRYKNLGNFEQDESLNFNYGRFRIFLSFYSCIEQKLRDN